jgi:hypothetical protein
MTKLLWSFWKVQPNSNVDSCGPNYYCLDIRTGRRNDTKIMFSYVIADGVNPNNQ